MTTTNVFLLQAHFATLNIPPTSDIRLIKAAYTRKALQLHPDKSGATSTSDAFTAVQEAWEALRKEYKTKDEKINPDYDFSAWNKWRPVPGEDFEAWNQPNPSRASASAPSPAVWSKVSPSEKSETSTTTYYRFPAPPPPIDPRKLKRTGYVKDKDRSDRERRDAAWWVAHAKAGGKLNPWLPVWKVQFTEEEDRALPFSACSFKEAMRRCKAGFEEPEEELEMLERKRGRVEE